MNEAKCAKIKDILKNLSVSCAGLLVCFLMLEFAFRLAGYGELEIYQPDSKLYWKLMPNQSCYTKVDHKPVHINANGTRGGAFDVHKPSNVFRILSLGDSRTFGWGLSEPETYSGLLERLLQAQAPDGIKVEVINAGVNAWSYAQIHVYLRDVGMTYCPDTVILAGANSWTQFSEDNNQEFIDAFRRRVWLKNLLRRSALYHYLIEVKLRDYYDKYRIKFIPVNPKNDVLFKEQQKAEPDLFFKEQIEKTCEVMAANRIGGLLIYIPAEGERPGAKPSQDLRIKRELSEKFHIPLIDLTQAFAQHSGKLFLEGDPVHPNVEGNRFIAHALSEHLAEQTRTLVPAQLNRCE
jgi:lysophospholipase L1-like esterase